MGYEKFHRKGAIMKPWVWIVWMGVLGLLLNGCVLTKVATVPMRIVGGVVSVVPVAGNTAHDAIDEVADQVDDLPF